MMTQKGTDGRLGDREIDEIVVGQVDDDSAWERPIRVRRTDSTPVTIPPELVARAAFLARLHRAATVEEWLTRIIQERVELEEAAYIGVKQQLIAKPG